MVSLSCYAQSEQIFLSESSHVFHRLRRRDVPSGCSCREWSAFGLTYKLDLDLDLDLDHILENISSSCKEVIRMSGQHRGLDRRQWGAVVPSTFEFRSLFVTCACSLDGFQISSILSLALFPLLQRSDVYTTFQVCWLCAGFCGAFLLRSFLWGGFVVPNATFDATLLSWGHRPECIRDGVEWGHTSRDLVAVGLGPTVIGPTARRTHFASFVVFFGFVCWSLRFVASFVVSSLVVVVACVPFLFFPVLFFMLFVARYVFGF